MREVPKAARRGGCGRAQAQSAAPPTPAQPAELAAPAAPTVPAAPAQPTEPAASAEATAPATSAELAESEVSTAPAATPRATPRPGAPGDPLPAMRVGAARRQVVAAGPSPAAGESLADDFWAVSHQLRGLARQALAPWDLPPSYLRALRAVSRHERLRLSELSEHLHVAPRSVTDVVDGLEQRGLARRVPDDRDRRAILVELTDAGAELLAAVHATRGAQTERFFDPLGAEDRAHLARILRKLRG